MRIFVGLCVLYLGFIHTAVATTPIFFVSMYGNDAWTGTLPDPNAAKSDGPFATLTRARDAVRAAAGDKGLTDGAFVYVRGGTYYLSTTLALESRDSGNKDHPAIWQAFKDERVRLVGGPFIPAFQREQGSDKFAADLSGLHLPDGPVTQVFFNGKRQSLARWPNAGEGDMPGGGWAFIQSAAPGGEKQSFLSADQHVKGIGTSHRNGLKGAQVSIWPNYNWFQAIADVSAIDGTGKISLRDKASYAPERDRRFFLQNVGELLDAPGEWWYDEATKKLQIIPPPTEVDLPSLFPDMELFLPKRAAVSRETAAVAAPGFPKEVFSGGDAKGPAFDKSAEVVVPVLDSLITVTGAHHVFFIGFTIDAARGDGVVFKNASECMIGRCVIRNTYGFGVTVSGGNAVRVQGNDIYETGRGGVSIEGGDRKTLKTGDHTVINNDIHHFARIWQTYNAGVNISGVGNRIQHNAIHDAPHLGIYLTGNEHVIEYNDIHHVCMEASDNGAFYMGRDWTQRGNTLRYNKIHDVYGFGLATPTPNADGKFVYESPFQAWGVYLDDCTSGTTVYGNIFYRVPLCGVMLGGGRDNVVRNNIFVDCAPALHIDARWDEYPYADMQKGLDAMNYKQPPYSERYKELLKMGDDPRKPANNAFDHNIIVYHRDDYRGLSSTAANAESAVVYDLDQYDPATTAIDNNLIFHGNAPVRVAERAYKEPKGHVIGWEDWKKLGQDKHSVIGDPLFFDLDNDDFTLDADSPALDLHFKAIPFALIGCYHDELRATWPIPADTRREGSQDRKWVIDASAK